MTEANEVAGEDGKLVAFILTHVQRYPEIDVLDVYKLLHQAVFGPGSVIKSQKAAREWLERESEILQPVAAEPLLESVHPEGSIVRLHLRPYLVLNGKLNKLLDTFVQSSKAVNGTAEAMAQSWAVFQQLCASGGALADRFEARMVNMTGRTRASQNWPASQHSPNYDFAYKPAYRVLTRTLAESLLKGQRLEIAVV